MKHDEAPKSSDFDALRYTTPETRTRSRTKALALPLHSFEIHVAPSICLTLHADTLGRWRGTCGSSLWTASQALIDFLFFFESGAMGKRLDGKSVLEVGSGLGAVGMAVAKVSNPARTTLTDVDAMLPLLRRNVDMNFGKEDVSKKIMVSELAWGENNRSNRLTYDIIVGADVAYDDEYFVPLVKSLVYHSHSSTEIFLGESLDNPELHL